MNFQQLEKIAEKHITKNPTVFPEDAFELAKQLNLRVKNSIECKREFKDNYPLYKCNAAYTLANGEYTIYYDEKYAYKNFSVAHEIAHHLLEHCSDGVKEHHDANLLAAILLLSPEGISKNKIKSAIELSEKCLVPYNVACEYWAEIKNIIRPKSLYKNKIVYLLLVLTFIITSVMVFTYYSSQNNNEQNHPLPSSNPVTTPAPTSNNEEDNDVVFITKYAKKYHKKNCFSISDSNVIQISLNDATNSGYEPCHICMN